MQRVRQEALILSFSTRGANMKHLQKKKKEKKLKGQAVSYIVTLVCSTIPNLNTLKKRRNSPELAALRDKKRNRQLDVRQ